MAKSGGSGANPMWKRQADATLTQAPASGTKYTVLDTVKNVKIISAQVICTWTVQPTPLELHFTIDGQAITHTFTDPVSATDYYPTKNPQNSPTAQGMDTGGTHQIPYLYKGKSIKIEAEITGGTVSNLSARVKYSKKV